MRRRYGSDTLIFDTTMNQAIWPFTGTQSLMTEVARGNAEEWVEKNFAGVEFEKIIENHDV